MLVAINPPLPGSLVCWFDHFDRKRMSLIVRVEEHLGSAYYVLTVIENEMMTTWTLPKASNGGKWRVLNA